MCGWYFNYKDKRVGDYLCTFGPKRFKKLLSFKTLKQLENECAITIGD